MKVTKLRVSFLDLKRAFKNEDTRFIMLVGLKVSAVSFAVSCFIYYFLYQVIRLNYAFFQTHGFPELSDPNLFFDAVTSEATGSLPVLFIFHICIFFIGTYLGWLILRPFRLIAEHSERVIDNPNAIYKVEEFNTYKLLTRFSEFFFEYLRESRKRGMIMIHSIPPQYSKIHKPVFDKIFMLHFGLLLVIITLSSCVFIIENASSVFLSMSELASKTLSNSKEMNRFFGHQMYIIDDLVTLTIILTTVGYLMLGFHLYAKVSGAAFGIFSTMRAFMKGNHSSRVHLVGYSYLRDYTRRLNKYLDYIQSNFTEEVQKE